MAYLVQADLENALGVNIVRAIYDDDGDGSVDAAPMAACIAYATAQVNSFLRNTLSITLPITGTPPDEIKFAAIDFACAYTIRRRPDLVDAMGAKDWTIFRKAAEDHLKAYSSGVQRVPSSTATPTNIGGYTIDDSARIITNQSDGTDSGGDF